MEFYFGKSATNRHGTEKRGERWNKQTVHGPRLRVVELEGFDRNSRIRTRLGWRLIVYFPSGAWWHFDLCKSAELLKGVEPR